MILVTVRDRRRTENLLSLSCAPAVPRPRDSRTSRAEATTAAVVLSDQATSGLSFSISIRCYQQCRAVGDTARFVQWGYSSKSDLGLDAERLLTDDVRSTRCSWQRWKKFQLCSWTWNIPARSMTPSLLKELTSDRGIDYRAKKKKWPTTLKRAGRTCKPVLRFPFVSRGREGGGGGWEWNLRSSFRKLLRTFATAPNQNNALINTDFLFGYLPTTEGTWKKGQKTLWIPTEEQREQAKDRCLKSCFGALIGTNRDESVFLGRRAKRQVSVSKSGLSRRDRDGWQVCTAQPFLPRYNLRHKLIKCWHFGHEFLYSQLCMA